METQPDRFGRSVSALRDPLVPLDFGTWVRRVHEVFRRNLVRLGALALIPAALSSINTIVLAAVRLDQAQLDERVKAAAAISPTGMISQTAAWEIQFRPILPVIAVYTVLSLLIGAAFAGSAYHLTMRQANGQPITVAATVRAATPQVPRFLGCTLLFWLITMASIAVLMVPEALTDSSLVSVVGATIAVMVILALLTVFFAAATGVVFVEHAGPTRCFQLVKQRFWATLGRTTVTAAILLAYLAALTTLITLVLLPFGGREALSTTAEVLLDIVIRVLGAPVPVFLVAASLVTYAELRFWENSSTTTRTLIAELGPLNQPCT